MNTSETLLCALSRGILIILGGTQPGVDNLVNEMTAPEYDGARQQLLPISDASISRLAVGSALSISFGPQGKGRPFFQLSESFSRNSACCRIGEATLSMQKGVPLNDEGLNFMANALAQGTSATSPLTKAQVVGILAVICDYLGWADSDVPKSLFTPTRTRQRRNSSTGSPTRGAPYRASTAPAQQFIGDFAD